MRYRDRLHLWESDPFVAELWDIEFNGVPIAYFHQPQRLEMFWTSYLLEVTTTDSALAERLRSVTFWTGDDWAALRFRHRVTGMLGQAFPAIRPFVGPNRIAMRGLRTFRDPAPWDRLVLKLRKWTKKNR